MYEKMKPCPFCGHDAKVRYHESRYLGVNIKGLKKIKFTAYGVCKKCLSRGNPVSYVCDNVNEYGWQAELKDKIFPLAIAEWNKRVDNENNTKAALEEACRQWCEFIDEVPERKDGTGFADFFYEIAREMEVKQ